MGGRSAHPLTQPVPRQRSLREHRHPFHSLELGDDALRALAGFILEGKPHPDDVDPDTVHLNGYRVTDPQGPDPALGRAALERAVKAVGPPQIYRFTSDGSVTKSDDL